ncbi:MAG: hypothetical protein ACSLFE_03770 [Gemmatimonadaceae bacterium]
MKMPYWLKNLPTRLRGIKQELMLVAGIGILSELSLIHIRLDGTAENLGVVSRRVITTAGVNFIRDAFRNVTEAELMNYHASGTGAVAEAVGDTALGTEVEAARVAGTQSGPSAGVYRTVATIAYTATRAITEHGVFSATSAGTLLDRSVFSAVNVVNGESIQFQYDLTFPSGG